MASGSKVVRKVVRVVRESTFLHFYLDCGHLITQQASDSPGNLPSECECWACAEEQAESAQFDERLKDRLKR